MPNINENKMDIEDEIIINKRVGSASNRLSENYEKYIKILSLIVTKVKSVIRNNKKLFFIISGAISIFLLFIVVFSLVKSEKPKHVINKLSSSVQNVVVSNPIHDQLNDISAKLANLEQTVSHRHSYVNLDKVRSDLSGLQSQVNQLAGHSNQIITNQIKNSTALLQTELASIKGQLRSIAVTTQHHKLLPPSVLPFSVISIDNIQQSNVVTINYGHRVLPLDVGDDLAGWVLISASNANQKAQFKNKKNNYVEINLNELNSKV